MKKILTRFFCFLKGHDWLTLYSLDNIEAIKEMDSEPSIAMVNLLYEDPVAAVRGSVRATKKEVLSLLPKVE